MKPSKIQCRVVYGENGQLGISVFADNEINIVFDDLTGDFQRISKLCDTLNRLDVSAVHIDEIIEDFLE